MFIGSEKVSNSARSETCYYELTLAKQKVCIEWSGASARISP